MGGSGGGFFPGSKDPQKLLASVREAEAKALDQQFETSVNEHLAGLLSQYNTRDNEELQLRLDAIVGHIDSDIDGSVELRYGGSISKHTYVDGLSDVDLLVLLDKSDLS